MSLPKRKPSVSPPNQGVQSQARGTDEFTSFQQQTQNYTTVQPSYPVQAPLPHDMSKQSVVAGHLPASGIPQQTANIYQQPGILSQSYFGNNQQSMQSQRSFPNAQLAQANQPVYMYMGQQPHQYPAGSVMVPQQQMMGYSIGQRMPTSTYTIPPAQTIQQPYPPTAQYQSSQQYPSQTFPLYYQSQPMPVTQPQRPPSAPGAVAAPTNKRERKPVTIVDPNTGREVTEEILHFKSTPPGGSARSTPGSSGVPGSAGSTPPPMAVPNDIAAQFAAQVAATLRPVSTHSSSSQKQDYVQNEPAIQTNASSDQTPDTGPQPPEFVPAKQQNSVENVKIKHVTHGSAELPSGFSSKNEPDLSSEEKKAAYQPAKEKNSELSSDAQTDKDTSSVIASQPATVVSTSETVIHNLPSNTEQKLESLSETVAEDQQVTETVIAEKSSGPNYETDTSLPAKKNIVHSATLPNESKMDAPSELAPKEEKIDVSEEELALVVEGKAEVKVNSTEVEKPETVDAVEPVNEVLSSLSTKVPETESTVTDINISKDVKSKGKRKSKDINRKGEEKVGTDMDAFLDTQENEIQIPPETENNTEKEPAESESKVVDSSKVDSSKSAVEATNSAAELSRPVVEAAKPTAEPMKTVADVPKTEVELSKPLDEQTKPVAEESKEKTKSQLPEVKIVITEPVPKAVEIEIKDVEENKESEVSRENAKNNVKTNEIKTEKAEADTEKYKYKEDQWSPLNPEKKCQYDRNFLLQLQFAKDSMTKPNALPNLPDIILDKPYPKENNSKNFEPRYNMPDFTPGYARSGKMGGGGGGQSSMTKRGSQSRMREQRVIKSVSIQREVVQLHKSDVAWKPGHKDDKKPEEETHTEELNKKVKSILNKLTPQKFQTLLQQMKGLKIDTEERLKGVTDLIFEKAISEPSFSVAYANMCKYLLMLKVPSESKPGEFVNFRVILLTRCQREFERDNDDQVELDKKRKKLEEAESEEKKSQLREELEEESSNARRRSIGNIRFIGELFKLKMLTENIMHDCVFKLLRSRDEENLECLCRLLTTIGKELESEKAKPRMDQYFSQMQKIVAEKKVSSRCRFMLQDVIELRDNRWIPRRDENKPKTIDQIHREAKQEEIQRQMISQFNSQQPMKRNRARPQMGQGGMGEDGWNTVSSKAGMRNIDRNIDVSKLKINKSSDDNIQLGPGGGARAFGGWGRGSSGGGSRASQEGDRPSGPGNRYAALSKEEDQRARAFGRGLSPHRSQVRSPGSLQKVRLAAHGSQELERERALASARTISGRSTPPSAPASREGSRTREPKQKETEKPAEAVKEYTTEEMEQKTKAIIDEYLHIQDKKEALLCVSELQCPHMIHIFVQTAINHVLERSRPARRQTGSLLHDLIKQKIITVDIYLKGLNEILQYAEDMEIDIPKIWNYLGELIGPMVQDGSVPLNFLQQACKPLIESKKAGILVAEILHDASQELGHKVVAELWHNSGLKWTDFVPHQEVEQFLKEKNLEFTVGPSSQPSTPTSQFSFEAICEDLKQQLSQSDCDNEKVFDWIEANVSEETTKDAKFIRALMTAVCSSAISGSGNIKVDPENIRKRRALFQKYLEHKPLFELQALYALQALVTKLEHPPGVLRTFFDTLYDEEIISEDAFNQWENSDDPAEVDGKGVAKKQVVQFFAWLREGEEDENDS